MLLFSVFRPFCAYNVCASGGVNMCFFVYDVWVFVIFLDSMRKKTADYADARVASPLVLLMARARSRLSLAQLVAVSPSAKPAVAAALELLWLID